METLTNNVGTDRKIANKEKDIEGWGYDADPENDPTYPIKNWTGDDHKRLDYERVIQQPVNDEILKSIERPELTRVFGTSVQPRGVSGALRRFAFKLSEGHAGHWLTLILADRVDAVEGIIDDLKRGYVPNIIKERGWQAEWKYNRKGVLKNVAVGVVITSALVTYFVLRNKNKNSKLRKAY